MRFKHEDLQYHASSQLIQYVYFLIFSRIMLSEWDFGRRWFLAGNTKAILPDGPIMRDEKNHISTHA